jgi:hypothetical protein
MRLLALTPQLRHRMRELQRKSIDAIESYSDGYEYCGISELQNLFWSIDVPLTRSEVVYICRMCSLDTDEEPRSIDGLGAKLGKFVRILTSFIT